MIQSEISTIYNKTTQDIYVSKVTKYDRQKLQISKDAVCWCKYTTQTYIKKGIHVRVCINV